MLMDVSDRDAAPTEHALSCMASQWVVVGLLLMVLMMI